MAGAGVEVPTRPLGGRGDGRDAAVLASGEDPAELVELVLGHHLVGAEQHRHPGVGGDALGAGHPGVGDVAVAERLFHRRPVGHQVVERLLGLLPGAQPVDAEVADQRGGAAEDDQPEVVGEGAGGELGDHGPGDGGDLLR